MMRIEKAEKSALDLFLK